jgi:hypothetical protein
VGIVDLIYSVSYMLLCALYFPAADLLHDLHMAHTLVLRVFDVTVLLFAKIANGQCSLTIDECGKYQFVVIKKVKKLKSAHVRK